MGNAYTLFVRLIKLQAKIFSIVTRVIEIMVVSRGGGNINDGNKY